MKCIWQVSLGVALIAVMAGTGCQSTVNSTGHGTTPAIFNSTPHQGIATVQGQNGQADFLSTNGEWRPIKLGMTFTEGQVVRTGADTTLDFALGVNGGVLRIQPESEVRFEKLSWQRAGQRTNVQTIISVPKGRVTGKADGLSGDSHYEIKTPTTSTLIK